MCSRWFPRVTRQTIVWIGRGGTIAWPPRSPYSTHLALFVWRYVKDKVLVPLLPASLEELRARITGGCGHRCGHDS